MTTTGLLLGTPLPRYRAVFVEDLKRNIEQCRGAFARPAPGEIGEPIKLLSKSRGVKPTELGLRVLDESFEPICAGAAQDVIGIHADRRCRDADSELLA